MVLARCSAAVARGWGLLREPSRPRDMQHHALLCRRDARLFEAIVRDLRLRLFEGHVRVRRGARVADLRQGIGARWGAALLGIGSFGLAIHVLAASELGRSFRPRAGDGGVAHVAVSTASDSIPGTRWSIPVASAAVLCVGLWVAGSERKEFWLVSQPAAGGEEIDIWIAATCRGRESRFEREFAALLERAETLDAALRGERAAEPHTLDVPPGDDVRSDTGPQRAVS